MISIFLAQRMAMPYFLAIGFSSLMQYFFAISSISMAYVFSRPSTLSFSDSIQLAGKSCIRDRQTMSDHHGVDL